MNDFAQYKSIAFTINKEDDKTKDQAYASVVSSNNIHRNEYSVDVNNIIYARISGRLPGDGTFYTSHKCIITIESPTVVPKTFEYKVGREGHFSDIQTFVQYPLNYTPVIY